MKTESHLREVSTLFLVLYAMAVCGQTNLAASASASASAYYTENGSQTPEEVIDGITGACKLQLPAENTG